MLVLSGVDHQHFCKKSKATVTAKIWDSTLNESDTVTILKIAQSYPGRTAEVEKGDHIPFIN